ncbi:MAG: AAA family ATPase [Elusimicrobiota bacterium]
MERAASFDALRDIELLMRSHFSVILLDTVEEDRAEVLLRYLADRMGLPYFLWAPAKGLRRFGEEKEVYGTTDPVKALEHIGVSALEAVYHFRRLPESLRKPAMIESLESVSALFRDRKGAVVLSGSASELPEPVARLGTLVRLGAPAQAEYRVLLSRLFRDIGGRMPLRQELSERELQSLLSNLSGLTLMEAEKALTKAIVSDGRLSAEDIGEALRAKREIVERQGTLEYYPMEDSGAEVAGLRTLREWLRKRTACVRDPERAKASGLEFPKGVLLLGVQGCGKSLCARAVAAEWGLPLLKLDPSGLYRKFIGESEQNLKQALQTAEAMAPLVLWIDEIEKTLSSAGGADVDGGVSQRIVGMLLSWLQDRKGAIFAVATANDVSRLPPELLRKGRFDEIFFVDLPGPEVRSEIFRLHLARRRQDASKFDLKALAAACEGFSGAEIEQAVVSALYTAFSEGGPLSNATLLSELRQTRPLSATMAEKVNGLREWAKGRAVPAD